MRLDQKFERVTGPIIQRMVLVESSGGNVLSSEPRASEIDLKKKKKTKR